MDIEPNNAVNADECVNKITQLVDLLCEDLQRSSGTIIDATQAMLAPDLQVTSSHAALYDANQQVETIMTALQVEDRATQILSHLSSALVLATAEHRDSLSTCSAEHLLQSMVGHLAALSSIDYEQQTLQVDNAPIAAASEPDSGDDILFF